MRHPRPIDECYWVEPGRLLAGEYPGDTRIDLARRRLADFLGRGVTRFVDLTHPADGLEPYRDLLFEEARRLGLRAHHAPHPIPDMGVPGSLDDMLAALRSVREGLAAGEGTYVHCWGGVGRTGTVVGCWLVERGMAPETALAELNDRFGSMPKARFFGSSPQAPAQFEWVRGWTPRLGLAGDAGD